MTKIRKKMCRGRDKLHDFSWRVCFIFDRMLWILMQWEWFVVLWEWLLGCWNGIFACDYLNGRPNLFLEIFHFLFFLFYMSITFTAEIFEQLSDIGCVGIIEKLLGTLLKCCEWCFRFVDWMSLGRSKLTNAISKNESADVILRKNDPEIEIILFNLPFTQLLTLAV